MKPPEADVIVVSRDEPEERLRRLFECCAAQTAECDVYIAAPESDRDVIARAADGITVSVHHVPNPEGLRSAGLNRALESTTRTFTCRLDARTLPPFDYIARCVGVLEEAAEVGVVGGVQQPVAVGRGVVERGIARGLANPYAVGAPAYRRGNRSGEVDTVYLGAFRRNELQDIGGYNESLVANEDYELAERYRAAGKKVWLDAGLVHRYEARSSLRDIARQYRAFGRSKVLYWRLTGARPNARQTVALVAVPAAMWVILTSRRRIAWGSFGLAAMAALDHRVEPHERSVPVRFVGTAVACLLPLFWFQGVIEELPRIHRRPTSS